MFFRVGMKVLVEKFAMTVHMPVDKVCRHQQIKITHHTCTVTINMYCMIFTDNNGAGTYLFDNIEVMGCRNNRFPGLCEILDDLNEPHLAARVKTPGRFVKEEDIGICGQDRRDTDLLFFTAAQHVGRPVRADFQSPASQ